MLLKKNCINLFIFIALIFTSNVFADKTSEEISAWANKYTSETLISEPAAGVSILVGKGDKIIFSKAYGYADLENHTRSKVDTVYQIGSLTKQFTAVAILQLEEQGKLKLSDDITKYLPEYPTAGKEITIADILHHTSGIKNYISAGFADSKMAPGRLVNDVEYRLDLQADEMLSFFQNQPLNFEPGTGWRYSNGGYFIAGLIIEKASGLSYREYIEKVLFSKLSMSNSSYTNFENIVENRARGYKIIGNILLNANFMNMSVPYSAGALSSTVKDLFTWSRMLHTTNILLNKKSYQKLITPGKLDDGSTVPLNYALGIASPVRDGHKTIMHSGAIDGFSSISTYYHEEDITVIVLSNTLSRQSNSYANIVEQALSAFLFDGEFENFKFM